MAKYHFKGTTRRVCAQWALGLFVWCCGLAPVGAQTPAWDLLARIIELDGVYTVSILAHNPSVRKQDLHFDQGVQADYVLQDVHRQTTIRWSDGGTVFAFPRTLSLPAHATKVVRNFSHVPLSKGLSYRVTGEIFTAGSNQGQKPSASATVLFRIGDDGAVHMTEMAPRVTPKTTPTQSTSDKKTQPDTIVYDGSGGTEWPMMSHPDDQGVSPVGHERFENQDISEMLSDVYQSESFLNRPDGMDTGLQGLLPFFGDGSDTDLDLLRARAEDNFDTHLMTDPGQPFDPDDEGILIPTDVADTQIAGPTGPPVAGFVESNIWFVDQKEGSDSLSGETENAPFKTITKALSRVGGNGLIQIAPGIYDESGLTITLDIRILGTRGAGRTVIRDTTGSGPVLRIRGDAILQGLTIDGGFNVDTDGGILLTHNADVLMERCRVIRHVAKNGAGVHLSSGCLLTMSHSLIADNIAVGTAAGTGLGGAVYLEGDNVLSLNHVTMAYNYAENTMGGIYIHDGSGTIISVVDSIVWGNRDQASGTTVTNITVRAQTALSFSHSCFEGALPTGFGTLVNGGGNILTDPQFANPYRRDYRLAFSKDGIRSPCVNTGRNGGENDMGCFVAVRVQSSALKARLDYFASENYSLQMGGSILLEERTYDALGSNESYTIETDISQRRDYHGLLLTGEGVDAVTLDGGNNFASDFGSTLVIKNADVTISHIRFEETRRAIHIENDDGQAISLHVEHCLFDLGQENSSLEYRYTDHGEAIRAVGGASSPIHMRLVSNTFVHGSIAELSFGLVFIDDDDLGSTLVFVNNVDVARLSSGFLTDDWNALSLSAMSQLTLLWNNAVWEGQGRIVDRSSSPPAMTTFVVRQTEAPSIARDNVNAAPAFSSLTTRSYGLLSTSALLDAGVARKAIAVFDTSGEDHVEINNTLFSTRDLSIGDKVKLVNETDGVEEFAVIRSIRRPVSTSVTGRDRVTFVQELEHDYPTDDVTYLLTEYSEHRNEPSPDGDRRNLGTYGNTLSAATTP